MHVCFARVFFFYTIKRIYSNTKTTKFSILVAFTRRYSSVDNKYLPLVGWIARNICTATYTLSNKVSIIGFFFRTSVLIGCGVSCGRIFLEQILSDTRLSLSAFFGLKNQILDQLPEPQQRSKIQSLSSLNVSIRASYSFHGSLLSCARCACQRRTSPHS